MNNILKVFVFLLVISGTNFAFSHTVKFGHIDFGALIQIMPEKATAEEEFANFQNELEEVLAEMQEDYNTKLMELEQFNNDPSVVKRNAKLEELQDLQKRLNNFRTSAEQQASQRYQELLTPIFEKANKTIETVAREQGLIYVFDSGTQLLAYKSRESTDILPMVKEKMGID